MRKKNAVGCPCCSDECGVIRVTVQDCTPGDAFTPTRTVALTTGALVTVYDSSGDVVDTCTTDATGICEVAIPSAGSYRVRATKTGKLPAEKTISATCTTNNVSLQMGRGLRVFVQECGCPAVGVVVSVTQTSGGTFTGTLTTDIDPETPSYGSVIFDTPVATGNTFSYTLTKSPHTTVTGTITVTTSAAACYYQATVGIGGESTHFCFPPDVCYDPAPATIFVTFSASAGRWGTLAGTTVSIARDGDNYSWTGCFGTSISDDGPRRLRVRVVVLGSGCPPQGPAAGGLSGTALYLDSDTTCTGAGIAYSTLSLSSGTAACPFAFTMLETVTNSIDGATTPASITVGE